MYYSFLSRLIATTLLIMPIASSCQSLYPYLKDGSYGYADSRGKIKVKPIYELVTYFGSSEIFSQPAPPQGYNSMKEIWPKGLAAASRDSLWYLLDSQGHSLLGNGTGKISFNKYRTGYSYSYKSSSPFLKITTTNTEDGWGIWNDELEKTEGLVYTYRNAHVRSFQINTNIKKGNSSVESNPNHDLNPFRGGCLPSSTNKIEGCDCTLARRKDGTTDMLSPYGELVIRNVELADKKSWASLSHSEKKLLRDKALSSRCSYDRYPKKEEGRLASNNSRRKPREFLRMLKIIKDSLSQVTGKNYSEVKQVQITLNKSWACGLDTLENRIDVINEKGKIIHSATASEIPESIYTNRLVTDSCVFVKADNKRVLLSDKGKKIFPTDSYQDIIKLSQYVNFAFLKKDAAYPLHLYDHKWKRLSKYDIYGFSRNGTVLAKNKKGKFFCTELSLLLNYTETIEKGDFELVTFDYTKTKPPQLPKDRTPIDYDSESGTPRLKLDCIGGLENVDSREHGRLLVSILKQNNKRRNQQSKDAKYYMTDSKGKRRLIAVKDNLVHLDTLVDKFVAVKGTTNEVEVIIDGKTAMLQLVNKNKSFFKQKHGEMYTMTNGANYELRDADDKIISSVPIAQVSIFSLRPKQLIRNRYLLMLENNKAVILDDKGKILEEIETFDPRWMQTYVSNHEQYNQIDYDLLDKKYLRVYAPMPYLINLETMKVFKE